MTDWKGMALQAVILPATSPATSSILEPCLGCVTVDHVLPEGQRPVLGASDAWDLPGIAGERRV